jgi:hypothetical protein
MLYSLSYWKSVVKQTRNKTEGSSAPSENKIKQDGKNQNGVIIFK